MLRAIPRIHLLRCHFQEWVLALALWTSPEPPSKWKEKRIQRSDPMSLFSPSPAHPVLCLPGQNSGQAPRKDAEKASSSRKDQHQVLRASYLSDVKRALDKSTYSQFYQALVGYKKTDNYEAMVSVIAALTTERPEDFHLLQSKGFVFSWKEDVSAVISCEQ